MSNSIVLELQKDVLSNNCDVVSSLRKAHVICKKLNLNEMDEWINFELNGYENCPQDKFPNYRKIRGELKAKNPYHGMIPVLLNNNELETMICVRPIPNSISEIIDLVSEHETLVLKLPSEQQMIINNMCNDYMAMEITIVLSKSAVADIVEKVKNALLEWTLKLEEDGILGEGLKFTLEEKNAASNIPQNVNNFYGTTNIVNGDKNTLKQVIKSNNSYVFNYDTAYSIVEEVQNKINEETIEKADKEKALEILSDIKESIKEKKKTSFIKTALIGLKDFLISVGAGITAALIQSKLGI
ncbi:MAG: ABC transporter substrate-binding protein [Erysipelotrichaceae bacterium]|nr:ABC transporter substrate-binding protein [Erysipelotrichaceae bacterium]